ncbi:MAG TPA: hypothetical protein VGS08_05725 [Candidatus Saccharimonadales bacterium]|nr:hypothetical protein [Candidatus Saccharimonadales bacterium]
MSQVSCDAIFAVLAKHYTKVGITIVNNLIDLDTLLASRPDLVFLGMEFIPNNLLPGLADPHKIWLSDVLDQHGIAYTGSGQMAHELGRNKHQAKQRVLDAKLRTSPFCIIRQTQTIDSNYVALNFPLFIKPTNRGGGVGIDSDSVAYCFEQLQSKVNSISNVLHADALIEEYLPGREFSVAILKGEDSSEYSVMPIELVAPPDNNGIRVLSNKVKSSNMEKALAVVDEVIKSEVATLALDVFHALGARDYGRIDIRLDADGVPNFLEANLIPSLISGYGSFPKACVLNIGLSYDSMIMRIATLGLAHNACSTEAILEPIAMNNLIFPSSEIAFEPA